MILNELFDNPYQWEVDYEDQGDYGFSFMTDDQLEYKVDIVETFSDLISDQRVWNISFSTEHGRVDLIGGVKNPPRVFATVLNIIRYWVKKENPNNASFTSDANEPSRVRLYERLISVMAAKMGFTVAVKDVLDLDADGKSVVWLLKR